MSFTSWLSNLRSTLAPGRAERYHRRRPAARRLTIEALEDRTLPSCMVSLAPSEAAPQLVGERITWTATTTDCGTTPVYQFSAAPHGGAEAEQAAILQGFELRSVCCGPTRTSPPVLAVHSARSEGGSDISQPTGE